MFPALQRRLSPAVVQEKDSVLDACIFLIAHDPYDVACMLHVSLGKFTS